MDTKDHVLEGVIKAYFKRLSILTAQIPYELRGVLLPSFMLYNGFKSYLYVDQSDKLGFEIIRERASRLRIKRKDIGEHVEQQIFGFFGDNCAFNVNGSMVLSKLVFTSEDFAKRYGQELPKAASVFKLQPPLNGLAKLSDLAHLKIMSCSVYFMSKGKRYVKHIPFAWLFGKPALLDAIDPSLNAESDFYSSLFGTLHEIVIQDRIFDPDAEKKALMLYIGLMERVQTEFKKELAATKTDEHVFQRLATKYKFFLRPDALLIESQPSLRGEVLRKPDFHVQLGNEEHIYVEIEPPFCKPFEDSKMSKRLEGALDQVAQWKGILNHNEKIHYLIIIGFLDDLNAKERKMLAKFKAESDVSIVPWDWILSNIESLRQAAMRKSGS